MAKKYFGRDDTIVEVGFFRGEQPKKKTVKSDKKSPAKKETAKKK